LVVAVTTFTFLFLHGSRSLNEPDEGRYAEIAREMLETGNWLVPHFWYMPHLDKPPLTYWVVAVSMAMFGTSEWAVRLPLALAGMSGVWAAYLFGRTIGGRRAGIWSALILQSSLLYFVMARMLTTDIFLTQFIAWAMYFAWRAWRVMDDLGAADETVRARSGRRCFAWQLASWAATALGFLTKGPLALVIPLAAFGTLIIARRRDQVRWQLFLLGSAAGFMVFGLIVGPWFLHVFEAVPQAFDYMIKGQALGHALGTTIKNRSGSLFYFVPILAVGLLPWTLLLGWLWHPGHWRNLDQTQKEGWLLLTMWAGFSLILFSLMRAKLPAYILPLFPPLAVMIALRWFANNPADIQPPPTTGMPPLGIWRGIMLSPLALMLAIPITVRFVFETTNSPWVWLQCGFAGAGLVALLVLSRGWSGPRCARWAVFLGLTSLFGASAFMRTVEGHLKSNQTLKPLAAALQRESRSGDVVICWGALPQGLPFYAYPSISARQQPYFGGLPLHQVPFEFPGNRERFGERVLPNAVALIRWLESDQRVLVVGFHGTFAWVQTQTKKAPPRLIARVGRWELFTNQ
jgi:4-amino-4-deoxy-L-arabinose transferase-like glycosyltransferase